MPGDTRILYDAFVTYPGRHRPVVQAVAKWLTDEAGLRLFTVTDGFDPSEPLATESERALRASHCWVAFVDPRDTEAWQLQAVAASLGALLHDNDLPLIPVLLPGGTMEDREKLPVYFRRRLAITFNETTDELHTRGAIANAILRARDVSELVPENTPEFQAAIDSPYRGFRAYREEDGPLFFGRDRLLQQILFRLHAGRFLAILGPPYSGKSSLIRAGLLPEAKAQHWLRAAFRPGSNPIESLAEALTSLQQEPGRWSLDEVLENLEQAGAPILGVLAEQILRDSGRARMLLALDPFEEIFSPEVDPAVRARFLKILLGAVRYDTRLQVVIAMRSDHLGDCVRDVELDALVTRNLLQVGPFTRKEAREVVIGPAVSRGLAMEEGLADLIANDLRGDPGELPLLSFTLEELFRRRHNRDGRLTLTLDAYREMEGLRGSIAHRAEAELARSQERYGTRAVEAIRKLFVLHLSGARATLFSDALRLGPDPQSMRELLSDWIRADLLVQEDDAGNEASSAREKRSCIRVAHEALLTNWPRYQKWLEIQRDDARAYAVLSAEAQKWRDQGRTGGLLMGARLFDAEELAGRVGAELPAKLNEFIAASAKARDEAKRGNEEILRRELRERDERISALEAQKKAESERAEEEAQARMVAESALQGSEAARARAERRARWLQIALVVVTILAVAAAWVVLAGTH